MSEKLITEKTLLSTQINFIFGPEAYRIEVTRDKYVFSYLEKKL